MRRTFACCALLMPALAWADPPRPARVAVQVIAEGVNPTSVEAALKGIRTAIEAEPMIFTLQPDVRPPEPTQTRGADLGKADQLLAAAETEFSQMELDKAKQLLAEAIELYRRDIVALGARTGGTTPLRDAWIKLAKTRFFDGDNDGSRDALRYAFVLDPALSYSPKTFPPQMKKAVLDARALFDALGAGAIQVRSDPPGAMVYVNGVRQPGPTPTTEAVKTRAGPNYVTIELAGYELTTELHEVGFKEVITVDRTLKRVSGAPFERLERVRARFDQKDVTVPLAEAARTLDAEVLVVARCTTSGVQVRIEGLSYDARTKKLLKRDERSASATWVEGEARDLGRELVASLVPKRKSEQPEPERVSAWKRFRESKAFWWVMGGIGAALVTGAAVGVGVGVGRWEAQPRFSPAQQVVLIGGH